MVPLHLVDRSRPDPWQPDEPTRQLMVSVYYPAIDASRYPLSTYMLPGAAAHFDSTDISDYLGLGIPSGQVDWSATGTHAHVGAPVDRQHGGLPVVVYSPGLGEPRTWGTTLVTNLASRGYVVVTIDNTYESPEVQFPDGSVRLADFPPSLNDPSVQTAYLRKAAAVRVSDTSFVLDQLTAADAGHDPDVDGQPLPPGFAGAMDLAHVGMVGHSLGGSAAAEAMAVDPRITAGIDMDGNLNLPDGSLFDSARDGLDRPFLLLGKDGPTDTGPGWQAFLADTHGWARQLTLSGAEHASFTDAESLLSRLAGPLHLPAATVTAHIGTIPPAEADRYQDAYVTAFFDQWLRNRDNHLLDGPSPCYPRMKFVH
jgi:hypothetical protein